MPWTKLKTLFFRYLNVPIIVLAAFLVKFAFIHFTGKGAPYVFFFGAVLATSFLSGTWGGLFGMALSAPLATYYFVYRADYSLVESVSQGILFCIESMMVIFFVNSFQRSKLLAEQSARIAIKSAEDSKRIAGLLETMIATVSHDLKSPLAAMNLNIELIKRLKDKKDITPYAEKLKISIDRMLLFINSLLDVSTIESGRITLSLRSVNIRSLFQEVMDVLDPIAQLKNITIKLQVENDAFMQCDKVRIMQALSNLISNAIKFTPISGEIKISASKIDHLNMLFSITDSGIGIKQDELQNVFDRFWKSNANESSGHGLGLYITKGIIEAHFGKMWVESNYGSGTTFSFKIPVNLNHSSHLLSYSEKLIQGP